MPHNIDLILTVTAGLAVALVFGVITHQLKLSPIVGYLLAGIAVGPFTPGFVANLHLAEQLAELGVILLMFGVGLHFHPHELLAVKKIAIPGALAQIVVATALGALVTWLFGWTLPAGIVFGLCVSVASTVVLLRVLSDNDKLHTPSGHIAVGWLLVEDVFTVVVLVLLPVLSGTEGVKTPAELALAVGVAVAKIAALITFTIVVGRRALPAILGFVVKTRSRELLTLSVLAIALGIAVGSAALFGVSMALGAFLAGMVVGQSDFGSRAGADALPMRDAFAVLFFVSVGMLFDPRQLMPNAGLMAATVAVIVIGKSLAAYAVIRVLRYPTTTAVAVAVVLAQIGEFSFILAALARQLGILPEQAQQILVGSAIITITLNPLLFRLAQPLAHFLSRRATPLPDGVQHDDGRARAIVVGYGPVGRTVSRLLKEHAIEPTIIDLNIETVKSLKQAGMNAIYGDAEQREILETAGAASAVSLVFTASGSPPEAMIRAAREIYPKILILARSQYISDAERATAAGANIVITAETEVAFAMSERLLVQLGATSDQVDRARDQLRREMATAMAAH
jgi:CPA2 family monovalent cation:H+ antiporter-2